MPSLSESAAFEVAFVSGTVMEDKAIRDGRASALCLVRLKFQATMASSKTTRVADVISRFEGAPISGVALPPIDVELIWFCMRILSRIIGVEQIVDVESRVKPC